MVENGLFKGREAKLTADGHSYGPDCLATYVDIKSQPRPRKEEECRVFILSKMVIFSDWDYPNTIIQLIYCKFIFILVITLSCIPVVLSYTMFYDACSNITLVTWSKS